MRESRYSLLLPQENVRQFRSPDTPAGRNPPPRSRAEHVSTAGQQNRQDRLFLVRNDLAFLNRDLAEWNGKRLGVSGDCHLCFGGKVVCKKGREIERGEIVHVHNQEV